MTNRDAVKVVSWFLAIPLAILIGIVVYYQMLKKGQVNDLIDHGCSEELAKSLVDRGFYEQQLQTNYSGCTGIQQ